MSSLNKSRAPLPGASPSATRLLAALDTIATFSPCCRLGFELDVPSAGTFHREPFPTRVNVLTTSVIASATRASARSRSPARDGPFFGLVHLVPCIAVCLWISSSRCPRQDRPERSRSDRTGLQLGHRRCAVLARMDLGTRRPGRHSPELFSSAVCESKGLKRLMVAVVLTALSDHVSDDSQRPQPDPRESARPSQSHHLQCPRSAHTVDLTDAPDVAL